MTIKQAYKNGNGHAPKVDYGDRLPPQDKEAERALIGCLLTDPEQIHEVSAVLSKDDFYLIAYGLVFEAIQRVTARGERPDIINVMAELRTLGHADIGDGQNQAESFLVDTLTHGYFTLSTTSYARTIAEMATRRRLIAASQAISTLAWDEKQELPDILETSRKALFTVSEKGSGKGLSHISGSMREYMDMVEARAENPGAVGLMTGFLDLDRLLNGLQKSKLIIIAGRPSMGKTGLMMAMADEMTIERGKRGAVFSLEMSNDELINRIVSRRIKIDTQRIDRGELSEQEWPLFYENSGKISSKPLFIDDRPGASITQIRAQAMKQQLETGLDYIMVDYLGLVTVGRNSQRYEQVSEAARFFKNLAKEIDVPVIVTCQLSRAIESRSDKRPQLADLRDSGEIEEAADIVIGLYRDDYYNPDSSERPNIGELHVIKHRGGPLGSVDLFFHSRLATYRNLQMEPINLNGYHSSGR